MVRGDPSQVTLLHVMEWHYIPTIYAIALVLFVHTPSTALVLNGVVRHCQSSVRRPIDHRRPPVVARLVQSSTSPTYTYILQLPFFQADLARSPGERAI